MIKKDLFVICCIFLGIFSSNAWSQYQYEDQEAPNYSLADQTKNDMLVITAAGVGGGIIGLSTLSFVEKPGDHFDNVLTGAALGLIMGVLYVAYRQAYGPSGILTTEHKNILLPDYGEKDLISRVSSYGSTSPLAFQWTWQFE